MTVRFVRPMLLSLVHVAARRGGPVPPPDFPLPGAMVYNDGMDEGVPVYVAHSRERGAEEQMPGREFRGTIEKFWLLPRREGRGRRQLEIMPDGNFDLVFLISERRCTVLYTGPFTEARTVPVLPGFDYFCVRFRPGKMPRLADVTAGDLVDGWVELPRVLGTDACQLGERLLAAPGLEGKRQLMERLFREGRMQSRLPGGPFLRCAEAIEASRGMVRVEALARRAGLTARTLERLFREHAGLTPKTFIRMVRFQHALSLLRGERSRRRLADIACDCGYADQSHFIREFKSLSRRLPGAFSPERIVAPDGR